jgi:hypothetical protein
MFRKLAIAAAAAVTLGAGMAAAPAPAEAQGFGFYFGDPGYRHHRHGYGPGYGYWGGPRRYYNDDYRPRRHCERVVVRKRVYGEWRRVVERRCYPRGYRY